MSCRCRTNPPITLRLYPLLTHEEEPWDTWTPSLGAAGHFPSGGENPVFRWYHSLRFGGARRLTLRCFHTFRKTRQSNFSPKCCYLILYISVSFTGCWRVQSGSVGITTLKCSTSFLVLCEYSCIIINSGFITPPIPRNMYQFGYTCDFVHLGLANHKEPVWVVPHEYSWIVASMFQLQLIAHRGRQTYFTSLWALAYFIVFTFRTLQQN